MSFRVVDVQLRDGLVAKGLVDFDDQTKPAPRAIVVDFESPKLLHRLKNNADGESIVKAVGLKRSLRRDALIYDFTAGLGVDAFLLARAGFTVVAFERDPRVFELLEDGLRRYKAGEQASGVAKEDRLRLEFHNADAAEWVARKHAGDQVSSDRPYAVTLDPMFEGESTETKSRPKKEMALLRKMLPASDDEGLRLMFNTAFAIATARVVVKRPRGSRDLEGEDVMGRALRPVHRLEGKSARFDIYSCR